MKSQKKGKDWLKEHPLAYHLLLMLAVSCVILIVIFTMIKLYSRHGNEVELPDMEGRMLSEVMEEDNLSLRFEVMDSLYKEGVPGGQILLQDPKGGSVVKPGRKVYITISSYAIEDAEVPEVKDLGLRQAMSRLRNAGFVIGSLTFAESDYATVQGLSCKGKMVYAGQQLPQSSKIDLIVGSGKNVKLATVPQLLGKTPNRVEVMLHQASLNIGATHYDKGIKDRTKAVVYRQEPEYTGVSSYALGTAVEVWFGERSQDEVDQMLKDFRVDSSKIVRNDINGFMDEYIDEVYDGDDWANQW